MDLLGSSTGSKYRGNAAIHTSPPLLTAKKKKKKEGFTSQAKGRVHKKKKQKKNYIYTFFSYSCTRVRRGHVFDE